MQELCVRCKGRGFCSKPCKILSRLKRFQPKIALEFSGSSPPEIFVGKYNYPNVFTGILAPAEYGETEKLSMPEAWHAENASIQNILEYRSRMIYSRFISNIRNIRLEQQNKLVGVMQEISMASKPVDMSFKLKKKPSLRFSLDIHVPIIGNPAPLKSAKLESNPKIERKVDYLANDTDVKANGAIAELYSSKIAISDIIKLLSAGMLGLKFQRKLVPTRWAISATDDTISKQLLEKIRCYPRMNEYLLFNSNYLGNYYEILLMPQAWSFEVIEASAKGYFGLSSQSIAVWQDYEFWHGRKKYANSVTGAYYANRLAACEYLEQIKRQASCLILREIRDEYFCPCGVGILREAARAAFKKKPEKFESIEEALKAVQTRFKLPISIFTNKSKMLSNLKKQTLLKKFIKV